VETAFRGIVPVWSTDFSKQYATIAALIGLQGFLAAARLDFVEATQEARKLAATLALNDILHREIWPQTRDLVLGAVRRRGRADKGSVRRKPVLDGNGPLLQRR
jgi:hypothetical protein